MRRDLTNEGNVGADLPLVLPELVAEAGFEQRVLGAYADFRTDDEDRRRDRDPQPLREDQRRTEQHGEQRRIDGMPHDRVRAGAYQFVILIEAGVDTELFA